MHMMKKVLICMLGMLSFTSAVNTLPASAESVDPLTVMRTETYTYEDERGIVKLPYRFYFPSDYNAEGDKRYPIVIFLHGAGERGTDNTAHVEINPVLFQTLIQRDDCIIIAPQCAANYRWVERDWGLGSYTADEVASPMLSAAMSLLKDMMEKEAVDASRVYAIGLSMGAFGVWDMLIREPDLFAAAIPSEGAGDPSKAGLLVDIPIWAFHGEVDTAVPVTGTREMVAAIQSAGGENIIYTEYPGRGHGCWYTVWETPAVYKWLFSKINASALPEVSEEPEPSEEPSEAVSAPQDTKEPDAKPTGIAPLIAVGSIAVIAAAGIAAACIAVLKKKKRSTD